MAGCHWEWATELIRDLRHLKRALQVILMYTLNKEPPTWSDSLPCTVEKLRPKVQGDTVKMDTGGTRHNFGESPYFLPLASAGCRPLSYTSSASPSTIFLSVSSGGPPPPPPKCSCHFCHLEPLHPLLEIHPEPPPLPLSVHVLLCSQTRPLIPEMGLSFKAAARGTVLWPLWLVQGGHAVTWEPIKPIDFHHEFQKEGLSPFFCWARFNKKETLGGRNLPGITWSPRNWVPRTWSESLNELPLGPPPSAGCFSYVSHLIPI